MFWHLHSTVTWYSNAITNITDHFEDESVDAIHVTKQQPRIKYANTRKKQKVTNVKTDKLAPVNTVKGKVLPYLLPSVGQIPVYKQSAHR